MTTPPTKAVDQVTVAESSAPAPPAATRRITARRKPNKHAPIQAGKAKDASSFSNIENPEATIAAYCGYSDIGTFRRFYTSALVLPFFIRSITCYRGYNRRTVLSLLGDLPYNEYWASDQEPEEQYPVVGVDTEILKTNRNYGMALTLYQMLRTIRKGLSRSSIECVRQQFIKHTGCELPPASALKKDEIPLFGPFPGECEVEPLNRCLCLLQHIKHTTNKSQWDKRFFGTKPWDSSVSITDEYVPEFMRTVQAADVGEAPDEFTGPLPEQTRVITVTWKQGSKHKKNAAYVTLMKDQDMLSQIPKSVEIAITSSMLGPEVRDRIREAFRMHENDAQLEQLTLTHDENDFPALDADWEEIFGLLTKHDDAMFSCILRERDDGESPWEYGGPPAMLRNFLETKEGDVAAKQQLTPEHIASVQRQIFLMTVPKLETSFDPVKLFGHDKDRLKKAYCGFDVSNSEGRRAWQLRFLPKLAGTQAVKYIEDGKLKAFRSFSQSRQSALQAAQIEGFMQAVDLEQTEEEDHDGHADLINVGRQRYYAYQVAIGGTAASAGPPIETSACALQMERIDDKGEEQYRYTEYTSEDIKRHPKPYQVNGAAWGLSTLFSKIPFAQDAPVEVKAAASQLIRLHVPGVLFLDQTGLGKSILLLQVALGLGGSVGRGKISGKPIYKPIMLIVPQNLIRQWAREVLFFWKVFNLVISYDDGAMEPYLADHVVSSSAVRAWPDSKLWPKKHHYLFDQYDPRNSRTIILTTPETNVERSLEKEEIMHPAKPHEPPQFDDKGAEIFKAKRWTEIRYYSRMEKALAAVLVDEATKIKTPGSKRQMAVKLLKARRWCFATATAMMNQGTCILGPLDIMWSTVNDILKAQSKEVQEWCQKYVGTLSVYSEGKKLEKHDVRRLALLSPHSAKILLQSDNRPMIATYFPLIEELCVLRRTTASRVPRDQKETQFFDIRDLVKPHHMLTRVVERTVEEENEFQWLHRDAAQRFLEAKSSPTKAKVEASSSLADEKVFFGTAEMRELVIITGSTQAAKFNLICAELDANTLVNTLDEHRRHGWTAFDVVKFLCKANRQQPPKTVHEYAAFMIKGSPMLRGLVHEVLKHIKENRPGKILITEDIPLLAWWWDLTLNLLGFKTTTFHSALTASERDKMIQRFNDPSDDLQAMVLPYDVGALGLNCQGDCSEVKVMSCAKNQGTETQAIFRPVRVNSPREVEIVKMFVSNSICGYRESRKSDKYIVELATRAEDPEIRALAVEMLNEYHQEVQAAQDDPKNQEVMKMLRDERVANEKRRHEVEEVAQAATTTVHENFGSVLDTNNIVETKRIRRQPERFEDIKWSDGGKRTGTVSEAERRNIEDFISGTDDDEEKDFLEVPKKPNYDPWLNTELDFDDASEFEDSDLDDSDVEEEVRERPLTDRQREKLDAKAAKHSKPKLDEASRQLAIKLLDDYDRVYTEEDLDQDVHLTRALKLIHAKKVGLAFDDVPSVHIKYTRFPEDMLDIMGKKSMIQDKHKPLLQHLLAGGRQRDFKLSKGKKRQSDGGESSAKQKKKATSK